MHCVSASAMIGVLLLGGILIEEYDSKAFEIQYSPVLNDAQKDIMLKRLKSERFSSNFCAFGKWYSMTLSTVCDIVDIPIISDCIKGETMLCNYLFDLLQSDALRRMNNVMFEVQNLQFNYRWAIDPSGYVFDTITNERIQGVKTTLYFKETLEDEAFLWNASEYSQHNPLYTDKDGKYAWDVPEGFW